MRTIDVVKPTIKLYYSGSLTDRDVIARILQGAEEQGIPVEIHEQPEDDDLELAFRACQDSILDTGIGVSTSRATVQVRKLKKNNPVYTCSVSSDADKLARVGENAARYVKRIPLRIS